MLTKSSTAAQFIALSAAVIVCLVFTSVAVSGEEKTPEEAVAAFLKSSALVHNYDLELRGHTKSFLKRVTEKVDGKNIAHYEQYTEGKTPTANHFSSRQVMADDKNFRTDLFDPEDGSWLKDMTSDGNVETTWLIKNKIAFIVTASGPMVEPPGGCHYSEFYRTALNTTPFSEIFYARTNLRHIDDTALPQYYVVETEPDLEPKTFAGRFGWKLWLDPDNGFLPVRIERYWGKDRLYTRFEFSDFQAIPGGIRMPAKAMVENFDFSRASKTFGQMTDMQEYEVNLDNSHWNTDLDPAVFKVPLPFGTTVHDDINNKRYVVRPNDK